MDNSQIKKLVFKSIEDLEMIIQGFSRGQKIPQIEIDLALSKTRDLYEDLLKLNKAVDIEPEGSDISQKKTEVEIVVEKKHEDELQEDIAFIEDVDEEIKEKDVRNEVITTGSLFDNEEPESDPGIIVKKEEIITPEIIEPIISKIEPEQKTIPTEKLVSSENIIKEKPVAQKTPEQKKTREESITKEMHENGKISINERILAENPKTELHNKIHKAPISDFREVIGINDRFSFIRELFGGDVNKYNETLIILNNCQQKTEAFKYINDNFKWDSKSQVYEDFSNLIDRRFS